MMRIEDMEYERREVVGAERNVIRTLILVSSCVAARGMSCQVRGSTVMVRTMRELE